MKEPQIQNAISLTTFSIDKCDFVVDSIYEKKDLEIKFQFANGYNESEQNSFKVKFIIELTSKVEGTFKLCVESTALFKTQEVINNDFKESSFATLNAPAIAFPFLRSFIQTFCVNAGIPPIILPSFNFSEIKKID